MRDYHITRFTRMKTVAGFADVPDLTACSAFGKAPQDALREVVKAKAAWLEAAEAEHKPIPERRDCPLIYQALAA